MSQYVLDDCPCCDFLLCGACPDRNEYAETLDTTCHFFNQVEQHQPHGGLVQTWDISHYNQSIPITRIPNFPTAPFGWTGFVDLPSRVPGAFPGTLDRVSYTVICAEAGFGLHWQVDVRSAQVSSGGSFPLFHFRARCFIPPDESADPTRTCGNDETPSLVLTWDADWELLAVPQGGFSWVWNDVPHLVALE